jgi:serine/threonine-protein kinase
MMQPGDRLGHYEVLDVLGEGQAAVTYRARHASLGREVALKVPHARLISDTTFYFRFLREAALGSRLDHPAIVRVLDSGEADDQPFLAMEVAEGEPLDMVLERETTLEVKRALAVARQVADALAYAHARGVVHRNLKPGHIMLLKDGQVKIVDFGVARDYGQVGLTESGVILGSPLYGAPEAKDPRHLDHRSDLYSLGVILFEMLQGHPPFQAASPVEVAIKHCTEDFPAYSTLRVRIPRAVWDIIDRLCRKQPTERPVKGTDVAREIDRILELVSRGKS